MHRYIEHYYLYNGYLILYSLLDAKEMFEHIMKMHIRQWQSFGTQLDNLVVHQLNPFRLLGHLRIKSLKLQCKTVVSKIYVLNDIYIFIL